MGVALRLTVTVLRLRASHQRNSLAAISKDAAFAHVQKLCTTLNLDIIRIDLSIANLSPKATDDRKRGAAVVTVQSVIREAINQGRTEDAILTALAQE